MRIPAVCVGYVCKQGGQIVDSTNFDSLAKSVASGTTRRLLVTGLSGTVLGLLGLNGVEARTCSATGAICREHANCCTGKCGPKDRHGRRRCTCDAAADCPAPTNPCAEAICAEGLCGQTNVYAHCDCGGHGACTDAFTGSIDDSDQSYSPCNNSLIFPYDAHTIQHPGGSLQVQLRGVASGGGTLVDPYLEIYQGTFDPSNPCPTLVDGNDDNDCTNDSYISGVFDAGTYVLVVGGFNPPDRGSYTLEFGTAPPSCLSGAGSTKVKPQRGRR